MRWYPCVVMRGDPDPPPPYLSIQIYLREIGSIPKPKQPGPYSLPLGWDDLLRRVKVAARLAAALDFCNIDRVTNGEGHRGGGKGSLLSDGFALSGMVEDVDSVLRRMRRELKKGGTIGP